MSDVIIETLIEKLNAHEEQLNEQDKANNQMSETLSALETDSKHLQKIPSIVEEIESIISEMKWSLDEMEKLTVAVSENNHLLQQPKRDKILHVHTIDNQHGLTEADHVAARVVIYHSLD